MKQDMMKPFVISCLIFSAALPLSDARANVAAYTQIISQADLTYYDGFATRTASASVTVTVSLVPAAPGIVSGPAQGCSYTGPGTALTDSFTITSASNGPDTYTLSAGVAGSANTNGPTAAPLALSVVLGATVTTAGSSATTIVVPSDGTADNEVNGIIAGAIVVINGITRTVQGVTDNPSGTSAIDLSVALPEAPGAGVLVAEQKVVTAAVISGTIVSMGTDVTVSATMAAACISDPGVTATSGTLLNTFYSGAATLAKYVRNVTVPGITGTGTFSYGGHTYSMAGITAKPGDILEYLLAAANTGPGTVSSSVVTDSLPTSFVSLNAGAYGGTRDITYVNEDGIPSYLTAVPDSDPAIYSAPALTVNVGAGASGSAGGIIASGASVLVLYQVTVNNLDQGNLITNSAQLTSPDITPETASVTVTPLARTPSVLELLIHAPALPGAELVKVSPTAYRTGSAPTDPFVDLPPPTPVGSATPINLGSPVPLAKPSQLHQGEPLFVRLTDGDQNIDPDRAETVLVTFSNTASSDTEVVRLTETGLNTGVFTGYLPTCTTSGSAGPYNGALSVGTGDTITARYVDTGDGSDTPSRNLLVDPYGIVLNSSSGQLLSGAVITVQTADGGAVTAYGDDGVSTFPSTITSGSSVSDSNGMVYSFPPGSYRFPFLQPGSYKFQITPPAGYGYPSTVATETIQSLPGGPFTIVPGSRNEPFVIDAGPAVRIDIPVDPTATSLWLQKSAGKDIAGHGDFIPFRLSLTNGSSWSSTGIRAVDTLPTGFRYRKGSARINDVPGSDPAISSDGRTLTFTLGTLAADALSTVDYVAEVTVGTPLGGAVNNAVAISDAGGSSNNAQATVTIRDDFLRTRSTLMGRVTTGACDCDTGEGPDGVGGVRVYLEDGSFVITDERGLFHFEGVHPGLHVVQVDLDSLPDGYEAFACTENSRFAGRAFSQFVETQGGALWRTDFHIRPMTKPGSDQPDDVQPGAGSPDEGKGTGVSAQIATPAKAGSRPVQDTPDSHSPIGDLVRGNDGRPGEAVKDRIALELAGAVKGQDIDYRVIMRGGSLPVREARLNVIMPEGVDCLPGSSTMDGTAIADPVRVDATRLAFMLPDLPAGWHHEITFRGMLSARGKSRALVTQAYLATDSGTKAVVLAPPAETILQLDRETEVSPMPDIVLRQHFPALGSRLNAEDCRKLDELASVLSGMHLENITVTGHTDSTPIAPRSRGKFKSNRALSWARARSVGHYLTDRLHLPPEKLFLEGKGSTVPIADNLADEGKALNRRVEVRITSFRIIDRSCLRVLEELSTGGRGEGAVPGNAPESGSERSSMGKVVRDKPQWASPRAHDPPEAGKAMQNEVKKPPGPEIAGAPGASAGTPSGVAAPAASGQGSAKAKPDPAPDKGESVFSQSDGILSPEENDILVGSINSVRALLDSGLTPRLLVDDKEVPAQRIGFTMKHEKTGRTMYSYIGVDFGQRGEHRIQFEGIDPFGNVRFSQTVSVKRCGDIASIRLTSAEGNVADGATPVRLRIELFDADGTRIPAEAELEIRGGTLGAPSAPGPMCQLPAPGSPAHVRVSREGEVLFGPVVDSGLYRTVLGIGNAVLEAETYVQPKMRDWILVGLAEGTYGYNTVSGNMENLQKSGVNEDLYQDGRVALFAKGQIKGTWLMTMAYDSAKRNETETSGLFGTINPDTYYTLYGDAAQQRYDAASSRKLYVKMERDQFYALFGDYDTGMTVTELSRYSRRMTGVKTELQARDYEINAFASQTDQVYARDEIPGDGTSGIYTLSHRNIIPNTEKITIEVRDRFRSEILVSSTVLNRFTDYSIDYDDGTIIFKEPIYYRDLQLNPITIVAEYETLPGNNQDYTYGGRAGLKLFDQRLKVGGSYVHEGLGDHGNDLYGADASFTLDQATRLRAEIATTDSGTGSETLSGNAYLAEIVRTGRDIDAKAYIREEQPGFGLGQQPGSETGTRKLGAEGACRLRDGFSTNGILYREDNLVTDATRDVAEGKLNYAGRRYAGYAGFLHADDQPGDGSTHESDQLTLGGKMPTLDDRMTLTLDYAQSIGSNDNTDFPTRALMGAEYRATPGLTLLAAQEFTWGTGAATQDTRMGMRSAPWDGADLNSSLERQFNENCERVLADAGLKQTWRVSEAWKVDAGMERSQTVAYSGHYQFKADVPPSSGTNEDFTSVSTGASYNVKGLTWDNRLEFRLAESEDKWGLMSGVVKEIDDAWAWSGRARVLQTFADESAGLDTTEAGLRFGLVFRPPLTLWILLDRLDFLEEEQSGGCSADFESWRLVNSFLANYRPHKDLQLSLHYAAKFVKETIYENDYSGYTDLWGIEGRYDLAKNWDIGVHGSLFHSWNSGQFDYCDGVSVGYNVVQNAWISLGYNLNGFEDRDFSQADFTAQGPFIRFRFKFDQESVKDGAKWLLGN